MTSPNPSSWLRHSFPPTASADKNVCPTTPRHGFLLVLLLANGCTPVFHHELVRTPAVDADAAAVQSANDTVYAYRIDATESHWGEGGKSAQTYARIRELSWSGAGKLPRQWYCNMDYGMICALGWEDITLRATSIRLYRPRFETVEIAPGPGMQPVDWRPATDWHGQEKALDDLLAIPTQVRAKSDFHFGPGPYHWLAPEDRFQGPLLFAADEYERLANAPALQQTDRTRLLEKAARLRADANGIVPLRFRVPPPYP